jgi:hypothetical protein
MWVFHQIGSAPKVVLLIIVSAIFWRELLSCALWSGTPPSVAIAAGALVVDTRDADHETGDLLQAGIAVGALPTLGDVIGHTPVWTG